MDWDQAYNFEVQTLDLDKDYEGEVTATLISRKPEQITHKAIIYIHGFVDYFFQRHLADWANDSGFNFYALDLRKHGRSILKHQKPNMVHSLNEYFEEIDMAFDIIRNIDGNDFVVMIGHSTGGLTSCLYLDSRDDKADALILNSPFFEFNKPSWFKKVVIPVIAMVGKVFPSIPSPEGLAEGNSLSIHKNFHGEWDYDLELKPLSGFEINFGWISAIYFGQKKLQNGLNIKCPVLLMYSDNSVVPGRYRKEMHTADAVLNVEDIKRHASKPGKNVTSVEIAGGRHDLILSLKKVKEKVFAVMSDFVRKIENYEV